MAPDIVAIYVVAYFLSAGIRKFVAGKAGQISENLEVNWIASITVLSLIIATVTILATIGAGHLGENIRIGYQWLASVTLFSLAQFLLTRQVTAWTSYLAVAATDSLWWCLSWSIWAVYEALLPNEAWIIILAMAPFGVALTTALSLNSMRHVGARIT